MGANDWVPAIEFCSLELMCLASSEACCNMYPIKVANYCRLWVNAFPVSSRLPGLLDAHMSADVERLVYLHDMQSYSLDSSSVCRVQSDVVIVMMTMLIGFDH